MNIDEFQNLSSKEQAKAILKHCMATEYWCLDYLKSLLDDDNNLCDCGDKTGLSQRHIAAYVMQHIFTGNYDGPMPEYKADTLDLYFWRVGICVFVMNMLDEFPYAKLTNGERRQLLMECEKEIKDERN